MKSNEEILASRMAAFNRKPGPRVGDFLRIPRVDDRAPEFTRFTHHWGDQIQTGGNNGSFYLGDGYISQSGGLDPGVATADIVATTETKEGSLWFFDRDISGAGRAVNFKAPFRVFTLRPGACTSGLRDLDCPYSLYQRDAPDEYGYLWTVSFRCQARTAFRRREELEGWAARENLALVRLPHGRDKLDWPANAPVAATA